MSRWPLAHRTAHLAAERLRIDQKIAPGSLVDPFESIKAAGLSLFAEPKDRLFGAYFPESADAIGAILLNAELDLVSQRHTASHELGHHVLGHGLQVDLTTDQFEESSAGDWDLTEATAEAFAAWFLMPRRNLCAALAVLGLTQPVDAFDVYRVSLMLGSSYRGTARHLATTKIISRAAASKLERVALGRVKDRLNGNDFDQVDRRRNVIELTKFAGWGRVIAEPGDRIILDDEFWSDRAAECPNLVLVGQRDGNSYFDVTCSAGGSADVHMDPPQGRQAPTVLSIRSPLVGEVFTELIPDVSQMV
ncbi:ImmA/IrrE family metallo-endopeptidase [Lentzea flaviverrucosa]|uniref:IrrE N-terminal-like domain-containing protein n=1 Tax=Lentzea flaviverrucosa TaxID=200379 RepID=A0A1H9XYE6_9PSEU|nr:ImmA/IrrE family metallo-endopeptidase [Lentzea flaviverrucosa]RDI16346.1 uncharacterized protein DUF955 [Lentzea flaviverrucosa]SES51240.1 protein of unknown function [Lentzea flaviverrucosa]